MSKLSLTAAALQDLEEVEAWSLQQWGEPRTRAYLGEIIDGFDSILTMPGMGRPRPEVAENVRSLPVGEHIIYHTQTPVGCLVLRVRHQRTEPVLR